MTADPVRAALLRERDLLHALTRANDEAIAAWDAKDDEELFTALDTSVKQAAIRDGSARLRGVQS